MVGESANGTAFEVEGEGAPVLLVHGMGLNRHMWDGQLASMNRLFRTIRYDLLGHGDSIRQHGPCALADFSEQVIRLLDHLRLERCALVGFSLGGMIGRAIAIAHPDRVSALAILNSPHDRSAEQRAAMMSRLDLALEAGPEATIEMALQRWFTEDFARRSPHTLDRVRAWMNANDAQSYVQIYRVLATGDAELVEAIRAIHCPTLVLACEHDYGNSADMARRMAALIPNARAVVIPGLKHMGLVEEPAAINAALLPFLEEVLL